MAASEGPQLLLQCNRCHGQVTVQTRMAFDGGMYMKLEMLTEDRGFVQLWSRAHLGPFEVVAIIM